MLNETPKEMLATMINKVHEIMGLMDRFQDSRSGSISFTKLEEAMMWLQVMTHSVPLKEVNNIVEQS